MCDFLFLTRLCLLWVWKKKNLIKKTVNFSGTRNSLQLASSTVSSQQKSVGLIHWIVITCFNSQPPTVYGRDRSKEKRRTCIFFLQQQEKNWNNDLVCCTFCTDRWERFPSTGKDLVHSLCLSTIYFFSSFVGGYYHRFTRIRLVMIKSCACQSVNRGRDQMDFWAALFSIGFFYFYSSYDRIIRTFRLLDWRVVAWLALLDSLALFPAVIILGRPKLGACSCSSSFNTFSSKWIQSKGYRSAYLRFLFRIVCLLDERLCRRQKNVYVVAKAAGHGPWVLFGNKGGIFGRRYRSY